MLEFFSKLFSFGLASRNDAKKETEAKAWLDDLRRNELSVNARRQIAPEEPVKAPGMAFGSAVPVVVPYRPAAHGESQKPTTVDVVPEYVFSELSSADSSTCDADGGNNLSCDSDSE